VNIDAQDAVRHKNNIEDQYIELLKRTLTFSLWPEPPTPVGYFGGGGNKLKDRIVRGVNRLLLERGLTLGRIRNITSEEREGGEFWPGYADTMVGLKRLDNIEYCIRTAISENIEGDFIETGVWRGGSCILMRGILKALNVSDRVVFVADSFEGLPIPDPVKYPADAGDVHHTYDYLAVSEDAVRENFARYNLLEDQVVFLKGFFSESLPKAPIKKLAVLRLDGDMYGSTIDVLANLYEKLSLGGFCIIDDYQLKACAQAVEDFRGANNIIEPLEPIDNMAKFWRKRN
jgi:O-methyltransferase